MKIDQHRPIGLALLLVLSCASSANLGQVAAANSEANNQILVAVGTHQVTAADLEQAVKSSPFATQFNTMEENEQASLRGDLLKRLVSLRLLELEAESSGLANSPEYAAELQAFRTGAYYRHYTRKLRESLSLPDEKARELEKEYAGNSDALAAAKSTWLLDEYRELRLLTLQELRERFHVAVYEERISASTEPETLILEGDGIRISYSDLVPTGKYEKAPDPAWVKDRLYQRAELLLLALAAETEHVDISEEVDGFQRERLPAFLMEKMEASWVPDEQTLLDYYQTHQDQLRIPERWHVGQLVLSSYAQATAMRKAIQDGTSLFELAGRHSIDPYGQEHSGDMGWLKEGEGNPSIEAELKRLNDGELSAIIETTKGYHLVTVIERRPGEQRSFLSVRDKLRQSVISEKRAAYLAGLQQKYQVDWKLVAKTEAR